MCTGNAGKGETRRGLRAWIGAAVCVPLLLATPAASQAFEAGPEAELPAVAVHDDLTVGPQPAVARGEEERHTVIPQPRAVALGVLAIAMALWGRRMVRA